MPRKNDWLPFHPDTAAQAQGRNFPKILENLLAGVKWKLGEV